MQSKFATVAERPSFPDEEEKVLKFWEEINAFQKQVEMTQGRPVYTFYDGPPFATGLPHYGHIAAGTIKDVVTRYAVMKGFSCERRFGWDCHGLPIEYEIDKIHKISSSLEREQLGVKRYNELCREIVMRYSNEWRHVVNRFGRWIDFDNDYKTMDTKFMESVWWTFKQIFDKDLVYRGTKIMPFSTACNTVLSNHEAGSNYKTVSDPAIMVTFPIVGDEEGTSFIAWTTTPWTLPSNLALAVNPEQDYVRWENEETGKKYITMKARFEFVCKQAKIAKKKVLNEMKGKDLVGAEYQSLFPFFEDRRANGCFRVLGANFVTTDAGTGVVHCAPGFGEDDYRACLESGFIEPGNAPVPIDQDGKFLDVVETYKGIYVKDADKKITGDLKDAGRLFNSGTIAHEYPFCWRSQTPLLYRGFDCWFINVPKIKDRLIELNKTNKWVPTFVQEKRFHNWLSEVKDWCFSRNRYWGNPIPIWMSDDGEEVVCVGSIQELMELSGCDRLEDIHKEFVDEIQIPSKMGKGMLKRIPEVFDCWFESGSMPFAQSHYPFSVDDATFMKGFPADFIAEGLDQTRGWFYTLLVISAAVKDDVPFKNLICNGIVVAEDGSKMSKSKKNYPDPMLIANQFGADACRLYLLNSPVVRAEKLRFTQDGVQAIVRDTFLPWYNAYRFCIQNISRWEKATGKNFVFQENMRYEIFNSAEANFTDRYIIAACQNMIRQVRKEMDCYHLYNVLRNVLTFLENLTNWYVRLNRVRMKGDFGTDEQLTSLNTLFDVLLSATQLMAPICPFITEFIYQNMKNGLPEDSPNYKESVHFTDLPQYDEALIDEVTEAKVARMQSAIVTGRKLRDKVKMPMKYPLQTVKLIETDPVCAQGLKDLQQYIKIELNCMDIEIFESEDDYIEYSVAPDNKLIGQAIGKKFNKDFKKELTKLTTAQIKEYIESGKIDVLGNELTRDMLKVQRQFKKEHSSSKEWACETSDLANVMLYTVKNEQLMMMGLSREVTNRIQRLRKTSGISIEDEIEIFYEFVNGASKESEIGKVVEDYVDQIEATCRMPVLPHSQLKPYAKIVGETEFTIPDSETETVKLHIYYAAPIFFDDKIQEEFGEKEEQVKSWLTSHEQGVLIRQAMQNGGEVKATIDGQEVTLKEGTHFFGGVKNMRAASS